MLHLRADMPEGQNHKVYLNNIDVSKRSVELWRGPFGFGCVKMYPSDDKGNILGIPQEDGQGMTYYDVPPAHWHFGIVNIEPV